MTNKLNLPASYAVMNEEEMTYTQGGSALGAAATVVGAVVLGSSYLWGISQARDWLSVKKNREGNFLTVAGRASDAIAADMAKSPSNFLRDGVSTAMVVSRGLGNSEFPLRLNNRPEIVKLILSHEE